MPNDSPRQPKNAAGHDLIDAICDVAERHGLIENDLLAELDRVVAVVRQTIAFIQLRDRENQEIPCEPHS